MKKSRHYAGAGDKNLDEYFDSGVNWVALSHHSFVSRKYKTSELFISFWKGKQKDDYYLLRVSWQQVFSLGSLLLITDKYVIIIPFSSGGQLLIA